MYICIYIYRVNVLPSVFWRGGAPQVVACIREHPHPDPLLALDRRRGDHHLSAQILTAGKGRDNKAVVRVLQGVREASPKFGSVNHLSVQMFTAGKGRDKKRLVTSGLEGLAILPVPSKKMNT